MLYACYMVMLIKTPVLVTVGADSDVDLCGGLYLHRDSLQLLPQVLRQRGGRVC